MSRASSVPLSSTNFRAVLSRLSISTNALDSSWSEFVKDVVNCARLLFSATNCWSFWCNALTNTASALVVAKRSPRPSFSAATASDSARKVVLICWPLPLRLSARDSTKSPSGPFG